MSTINKRVLKSFRKKLSNDQLTQLFNLLNRIGFNRTLKSKGGSVGFLMDCSLNQPIKINTIDNIHPIKSMYQNCLGHSQSWRFKKQKKYHYYD